MQSAVGVLAHSDGVGFGERLPALHAPHWRSAVAVAMALKNVPAGHVGDTAVAQCAASAPCAAMAVAAAEK